MTKQARVPYERGGVHDAEFLAALNASDDLAMVVRAHVVFENGLGDLIYLKAAGSLSELDRLTLLEKVDVCVALGCLHFEDRPAFRLLNGLRNRFAHDLGYRISDKDADALRAALSRRMDSIYEPQVVEHSTLAKEPRGRVGLCLFAMGVLIRINHTHIKEGARLPPA